MFVVIEYKCHGNIADDADRPDEYVRALHGPFASEDQARFWFAGKCPEYSDRHRCGPCPEYSDRHRCGPYYSDYTRYEVQPLCSS